MRTVATALLAALAILAGGCGSDAPPPLIQDLREGGHVLVMRHALTETATDERERLGDCAQQRNLSAAGRAQAEAIGAHLRALGIPIGDVRASPMCRTLETAKLAFGRAAPDRDLVSPGVTGTIEDDDRRAATLRALVRRPPPAGQNVVLVTHTGNIGALGQSVLEGELLVYSDGRRVGLLKPDALAALARRG